MTLKETKRKLNTFFVEPWEMRDFTDVIYYNHVFCIFASEMHYLFDLFKDFK